MLIRSRLRGSPSTRYLGFRAPRWGHLTFSEELSWKVRLSGPSCFFLWPYLPELLGLPIPERRPGRTQLKHACPLGLCESHPLDLSSDVASPGKPSLTDHPWKGSTSLCYFFPGSYSCLETVLLIFISCLILDSCKSVRTSAVAPVLKQQNGVCIIGGTQFIFVK